MQKTIGILGGLGHSSSALFHKYLVEQCQILFNRTEDYPHIIIYDFPASDIVECGNDSNTLKRMLETIALAISRLEKTGVDFLCIPCNTTFVFIEDISAFTSTPILNIVEEAAKKIHKDKHSRVGILATSTTINNGIYRRVFNEFDINVILPNTKQQEQIDSIIAKIDQGNATSEDRTLLESICDSLVSESSVTAIIIACTCIPVLFNKYEHMSCSIYDSLYTYAESTIARVM
ncbi:MAG TPA: amino acid racemase [Victivallales bacterium]|nr:amino acid racemase [Victivallales bacterium]